MAPSAHGEDGRGGGRADPGEELRGVVTGAVAKRGTGVQCKQLGTVEREGWPAHFYRVDKLHIVAY